MLFDSYAYSKAAFILELIVLTLVAPELPIIFDFHSLSIAMRTDMAFPIWPQHLDLPW